MTVTSLVGGGSHEEIQSAEAVKAQAPEGVLGMLAQISQETVIVGVIGFLITTLVGLVAYVFQKSLTNIASGMETSHRDMKTTLGEVRSTGVDTSERVSQIQLDMKDRPTFTAAKALAMDVARSEIQDHIIQDHQNRRIGDGI